jgi:hypothetical protein
MASSARPELVEGYLRAHEEYILTTNILFMLNIG